MPLSRLARCSVCGRSSRAAGTRRRAGAGTSDTPPSDQPTTAPGHIRQGLPSPPGPQGQISRSPGQLGSDDAKPLVGGTWSTGALEQPELPPRGLQLLAGCRAAAGLLQAAGDRPHPPAPPSLASGRGAQPISCLSPSAAPWRGLLAACADRSRALLCSANRRGDGCCSSSRPITASDPRHRQITFGCLSSLPSPEAGPAAMGSSPLDLALLWTSPSRHAEPRAQTETSRPHQAVLEHR